MGSSCSSTTRSRFPTRRCALCSCRVLFVGIALGYATCGEIGFEGRSDYAAIGSVTNLAARLSDEATGGQILVGQRLFADVEEHVEIEPVGEFTLKGFPRPVPAFNVLSVRASAPTPAA